MLEYDFTGDVVRGKYVERYTQGHKVIVLEPGETSAVAAK
jgi:hypothetical protein